LSATGLFVIKVVQIKDLAMMSAEALTNWELYELSVPGTELGAFALDNSV